MQRKFNRNSEALATSTNTVQHRVRQTARPPHTADSARDQHGLCLADQIERITHAITATELAQWLAVSRITIFKLARGGRIPCFRIGTCVRFDPRAVAKWLRGM